jgi:hypothetical protein
MSTTQLELMHMICNWETAGTILEDNHYHD